MLKKAMPKSKVAKPSSPKVEICQKCGDRGIKQALVFCCKCKVNAEHYYCLNEISKTDNPNVRWACHECESRPLRQSILYKYCSVKRNQTSSTTTQAVQSAIKSKKLENSTCLEVKTEMQSCDSSNSFKPSNSHVEVKGIEPFLLSNHSSLDEMEKNISSDGENPHNSSKFKKKRKLLHEDAGGIDKAVEELGSERVKSSRTASNVPANCRANTLYSNTQSIGDSIWSGSFSIKIETFGKIDGVTAYLSSKAVLKVDQKESFMPMMLDVELFPRLDVMPKSFLKKSPIDDNVALYFFPEKHRNGEQFGILVEKLIRHDLAMRVVLDCTELLIFTSLELPVEHWRFQGNHYLWGLIQKIEAIVSPQSNDHVLVQNDINHVRNNLKKIQDEEQPIMKKTVNEDRSVKENCKTVAEEARSVEKNDAEETNSGSTEQLKLADETDEDYMEEGKSGSTEQQDKTDDEYMGEDNSDAIEQQELRDETDEEYMGEAFVNKEHNRKNPDIGWKHAIKIESKKLALACIYCARVMTGRGRITRLKEHLAGGYDKKTIKVCPKVPLKVQEVMKKICEDKERTKSEMGAREKEIQSKIRDVVNHKRGSDPAWKHADRIEGTVHGMKCKYCSRKMRGGGITRFKGHLAKSCPNVPSKVQDMMKNELQTKDREKAKVEERLKEIKKKIRKVRERRNL